MSMGKADERLTLPQAAAWLRVTTTTLHAWVVRGSLQGEQTIPLGGTPHPLLQ